MWYVSTPQRNASREARRADRHDHELLQVDVVVGVHAAVDDVHHRHRQHVGVRAADVAVQRQLELGGGGLGDGQRHAEDGVGAEPGLVVRAVEGDELAVDEPLVEGVEAVDGVGDLAVDVARRRLARPCRRSGRRRRAARPPRAHPSTRRTARWPAPARRSRGTTSTSTVGLPRESSTSRPSTRSMPLTGPSALRRSGGSLRSLDHPLSAARAVCFAHWTIRSRARAVRFAHWTNGSGGGPSDPGIPPGARRSWPYTGSPWRHDWTCA